MLSCPRCGVETPAPSSRCDVCNTPFGPHSSEASPPVPSPGSDSSQNPTRTSQAEAATGKSPKSPEDPGPLAPGQPFGSRYRILGVLGKGGMGAVYQAWDEELKVAVALKVIRTEDTRDLSEAKRREERFKRELLLARRVTHRNVVRIHDLGEIDGIKYITMPYIEGSDLAAVLRKEDRLPVRPALRIARQIASGLAAAHEAGVVHRDLKPANIMIDGSGEASITDFGVARPLSISLPLGDEEQTRARRAGSTLAAALSLGQTTPGEIIGTLQYMAPEQAKGDLVDQRADVYAFGLILRHMLLGKEWAGHRLPATKDFLARLEEPPESLRQKDPSIPEGVDRIVRRCLQPNPADRFPSAVHLSREWEKLDDDGRPIRSYRVLWPAAAIAATAALVASWVWLPRSPRIAEQRAPLSVLVADFENGTGDPIFNGALEQALGIALEEASFVTTYPRAVAESVAEKLEPGSSLDVRMARLVSRREGIKVFLVGSIGFRGSAYEVSVRAFDPGLDPEKEKPLTTARARASNKAQVLQAIGRVASDVRGALGDKTPESVRLAEAETFTTSSIAAMNAYAEAQALNFQGRTEEALSAYREAVRMDPSLGRAWAGMGSIYGALGKDAEAEKHYEKALGLLDRMTDRERYRTLGGYYITVARNYEKAIENYDTLVKLYPSDNTGHANLALAALYVGDVQTAVTEGRKAIEIYPGNVLQRTNYAMYSMYAGDFGAAIAESKKALETTPDYEFALFTLALSHLASGSDGAAREAYGRLSGSSDYGRSVATMGLADLELYFGRYREALSLLEAGVEFDREAKLSGNLAQKHVALAEAHAALGERKEAMAAARQAARSSELGTVLFPAARVLLATGAEGDAREIEKTLESGIQRQARSMARLLAGEVALRNGRPADAIEALRDGLERHDSWLGRYLLGKAYLEAGHPAEALAELELCLKRKGEATDVFFSDSPSIRYLPPVHYLLGRAQEQLGMAGAAAESFRGFLDLRSMAEPSDALAADASRRLEGLGSKR